MLQTSARLLRLLALLQSRPVWPCGELAVRLGVSTRTVRADIERLRALGYRIDSAPGATGGYRLDSGVALPLLLDDEEATAVALGLRTAANGAVTGIEETALRALAKLLQAMPARLRHRVDTLLAATVTPPPPVADAAVRAEVLVDIALAIRLHETLRFDYTDRFGRDSRRKVEPERLVHRWGRWYLLAFDLDRNERRTFRADQIVLRLPAGPRFTPRPGADQHLQRALDQGTWECNALIRVHSPASAVRRKLPPGTVVNDAETGYCLVTLGANSPAAITVYLCLLEADFDVVEGADVARQLRLTAQRFGHAAVFDSSEPH
ncbi:WYL domain-containing protein [Mycobacteroides abscessus]|nr:WYL domain-containing protein [Mycobacteroides abscessus]MDM2427137.1 WYL domain-containing protein [Mycobacteroides abscessus]MDM2432196.1 WYL domain-containing protein [Mycobacteroides abscessus]MDM2436713.1 WYL domain-containing protein [Mycobacteroides abscessus]MDM2438677.1 WYL domain-containing protein [Mycobacteroides abscessus]